MLQAWTYKKFGFPVPYLVVGRWGLTPFPSKAPLRFIVGAPIPVPENPLGEKVSRHSPLSCQHCNILPTAILELYYSCLTTMLTIRTAGDDQV